MTLPLCLPPPYHMPGSQPDTIRIVVASPEQADKAWQMLIRQATFNAAEVWQDGRGFLFEAVRSADGAWSVRRGVPGARTGLLATP